ncbi:agrin-like [Liolophura sinensis]|uniref:agrin-like n=1 Tax=Liolophura sinensis TaxID=3198878 RepID=UPI00315937E9
MTNWSSLLVFAAVCLGVSSAFTSRFLSDEADSVAEAREVGQCGECDEEACPTLQYCVAMVVKDHCGCCNVCSTDVYQPSVRHDSPTKKDSPCDSVNCPKYKICMENMQGLPLCTCPSVYSCRRRRKEVCGTDNLTYHSRCHLRIAACNLGKRLKVRHKDACTEDEIQAGEQNIPKRRTNKRKIKRRKKKKSKQEKTLSQDKLAKFDERVEGRQRDSSEVNGKRSRRKNRRQKRRKRNKRRKRMHYKSRRVSRKYKFLPYRY